MTQVKIRHASFSYSVPTPDPIRPGETIMIEKKASKGQVVDIPMPHDLERGQRHGAFDPVPVQAPVQAVLDAPSETEENEVPASQLSDEELVAWIKEDSPTVQEVVDAAEGEPQQASRLLEAEDKATGGDSRKGVVQGLSAIINKG